MTRSMHRTQRHPLPQLTASPSNRPIRSGPRRRWLAAPTVFAALVTAAVIFSGCANQRGPYSAPPESDRNPLEAQRLNAHAAAILDELDTLEPVPPQAPGHADHQARVASRLAEAESLLRQALSADLFCGPAHNNLGIVYFRQSPPRLYEAASEYEWARKLIPGHPDPRVNLALTLERAGKIDDAIASCRSALESRPGHLPSIQTLARLQIKHNRPDERTAEYLQELALRGDDRWRTWARMRLATAAQRLNP